MPAEHGGWSFIGAPIILGLAVAPSWIGLQVSIAGLLMFLSRQPLKMAAKDILQGKWFPRTGWALGLGGAELAFAIVLLATAMFLSSRPLLLPTGTFLGVAVVQFVYDSLGKGRNTLPEIIGASAAAVIATIIGIAGGLAAFQAWLLAGILVLHSALAIVYVGVRLDLAHERPTSVTLVWLTGVVTFVTAILMAVQGWASWPIVFAFLILAARAVWGVSPRRAKLKPHFIGMQEIGYTLMVVTAAAMAVRR
jgi:hypothetical protein